MGRKTGIEWTGSTWTPIRAGVFDPMIVDDFKLGWFCEHVSEGCRFCYSERTNAWRGTGVEFKPANLGTRVKVFLDEKMLMAPVRWTKPDMVFVCSMTDLFARFVERDWIDKIFAVMAYAPHHTFQILTKRAERMRDYLNDPAVEGRVRAAGIALGLRGPRDVGAHRPVGWPLSNVWVGVSVEDQANADERIPFLLETIAAIRWLSCEPLLGALDLRSIAWPKRWARCDCADHRPTLDALHATVYCAGCCEGAERLNFSPLDWVVSGGESGQPARPAHPGWFRALRDDCASAEVPYLHKQNGEFASVSEVEGPGVHSTFPDGAVVRRVGKEKAGRTLDGVIHDAYPKICQQGVLL